MERHENAAARTIRRLGPGDGGMLRELMEVFAEAFDDPATYRAARPSEDYLADLLGREEFIGLAATEGDVVVGGLIAYELHKPEQERSEIYIYDLAVSSSHRRKGVATALIDEARAVAAERGAWVVYVQADADDDVAIALYGRSGAREDVVHFDFEPTGDLDPVSASPESEAGAEEPDGGDGHER